MWLADDENGVSWADLRAVTDGGIKSGGGRAWVSFHK